MVKDVLTKKYFFFFFCVCLILETTNANELESLRLPNCPGGGGAIFESPHYTFVHKLKEFKKNHECIKGEELPDITNREYFQKLKDVQDQINIIKKDNSCGSLLGHITKYEQGMNDSATKSKTEFEQLEEGFNSFPKDLVQKYHAAWSWHSAGCAAAKLTFDIKAHWRLYHELHSYKEDSRTIRIESEGEEAESCANVTAAGSEDLKNFVVKTHKSTSRDISIRFDPYAVPDQLKVYENDSRLIWDSGCKGSEEALQKEIKINSIGSKLHLKIKASCEGDNGTAWFVRINCPTKEERNENSKCGKFSRELKEKLKAYLDKGKPTFNGTFYNQVLCYEDLNAEVVNKFSELIGGGFDVASQTHCQKGKPCKPGFGKMPENLNPKRERIGKATGFKSKKKRLRFDQEQCPDSIKESDSLFQIISRSYCLYALDRLDIFDQD